MGVSGFASDSGPGPVQLLGNKLHLVVALGDLGGVKGVGADNIRAGIQVGLMDVFDNIRPGYRKQIVVALDIQMEIGKAFAAVIRFFELIGLNHAPHGAVDDQNAVLEGVLECMNTLCSIGHCLAKSLKTVWD